MTRTKTQDIQFLFDQWLLRILCRLVLGSSVPDLEEAVPRSSADGHAVFGHSETADAVVVAGQHTLAATTHDNGAQRVICVNPLHK